MAGVSECGEGSIGEVREEGRDQLMQSLVAMSKILSLF